MRFDRQPETKSCVGLTNFKVGTQVLLFKNASTGENKLKNLSITVGYRQKLTNSLICDSLMV